MTEPDSTFIITRTFNAPRELVFQAWTEAERLAKWWGPSGCKIDVIKLDFQPGGSFHYSMKLPNNAVWYGLFQYHEITPPERIVYASSFSDPDANLTRPPFADEFPLQVLSTLTFEQVDNGTKLTLHGVPLNATAAEHAFFKNMHASMQMGWGGTLDQLRDYLAS